MRSASNHWTRREWLGTVAAGAAGVTGTLANLSPQVGQAAPEVRDVPWLAEVQQPQTPPADRPAPKLRPLLVNSAGQPIQTLDAWRARRDELRREWDEFLGALEVRRGKRPELSVVEEDVAGDVVRQRVRYEIEPGLLTEAYLIRPRAEGKNRRAAVVFHSTVDHSIRQPAGVEGVPEKFFGIKLAQRGFVTFSPRNFLWPDNHRISANDETRKFRARHPRATGMAKMLYDALVAVDLLAAQPDVDAQRIASVGHSLGAKEVLYLAAFDERIKATVSSEGGVGTRFSNWDAEWYLGPRVKAPEFKAEHHELLALAAPRPFLLVGGDSADGAISWPFIEAALPVWKLYGEPARLGLLNHRRGHAIPTDVEPKLYEWLEVYT